ncbi:MAG TPA: PEGA domain-containing protein, partial [Vicinamibacterales bacterium]
MNPVAARTSAPPPVVFRDAFGERRRIVAPSGSDALDVLCLKSELTAVPSFEFALRERVSRLAGFRHPYFAQIRTVERLSDTARTLALISNAQTGVRVSELLATASKHDVVLDSNAALCLIRQLVTAMATFHEQAPDAAHGALGPERVVVTPKARLVIVEHVMGSAIEQLQYSEDRYWRELRVPCPRAAGLPVIDHRADVLQLGLVALSLLLRRCLNGDEFPSRVGDAVVSARAVSADGHVEALPSGLRPWLTSTLQLDPRTAFASAIDAREELEKVFERNDDLGAPSALEAFLARYHERIDVAAEQSAHHGSAKAHVAPEPVVSAPVAKPIAPEPPAREPVERYASPSLTRPMSPSLERISAPPPASEPVWPESRHAAAQEPLRQDPIVREPISVTPVPRELPAESPSLAMKQKSSAEPAHKPLASHTPPLPSHTPPLPSYAPLSSHTSLSSHPSFGSHAGPLHESDEQKEPFDMASRRRSGQNRKAVVAVLVLLVAGGGTIAARRFLSSAPVTTTGTVVVTTNPPGAQVMLDGKAHGVSPATLTVEAGTHVLELRGAGEPRTMSLDVAAGAQVNQYIEMAKGPLAAGSLHVRTEPAGAKVSVDGVARGSSPLVVADLAPGEHSVTVEGESGSMRQTV